MRQNFWVLEKKARITQFCEKKLDSNTLSQQEIATKFDQMEKTDGDKSHFYAENMFVLESFHKPNRWELFQHAQLSDQSLRFMLWKFLDEYGVEVAIPSICKPWDVTYVVISRATERFVNEIHTHEAETRSSGALRENLQESKESMSYKQREVPTSPKETWVASSTGEKLVQAFSILFHIKAPMYTRKTILKDWEEVHYDSC